MTKYYDEDEIDNLFNIRIEQNAKDLINELKNENLNENFKNTFYYKTEKSLCIN